ncbi:hypothetical protein BD410DRAFT_739628 [Rickenella mellea]|uniref:2-dehydropantoate 2-reductase n=1 Tax=Rickenella mellea TaxID=50990 RepID=A0A4Y7QKF3_9AGAM|nr:hypothetical protein BD410DRAFT_739628 [Rickenella mellea]
MRFHVVGVGPIGSLVAFHMRRTLSPKHDVSLLLRTLALAKQNREPGWPIRIEYDGVISSASGFQIETMEQYEDQVYRMVFNESGKLRLPSSRRPSPTQDQVEMERKSVQHEDIKSLFVACKAYSTSNVLRRLQPRLNRNSTIVLLQNGGLGVYEEIIDRVFRNPEERPSFVLVSNNHGAWLKSPYHIVHAGVGTLHFGIVPDGRRDFERALQDDSAPAHARVLNLDDITNGEDDPLYERYQSLRNTVAVLKGLSDLQPTWHPISTLQLHMRRKLVVNSVVNPLTAIMGCRNGDLFANINAIRLADRICGEASQIFAAEAKAQARATAENGLMPGGVYIPPALRKKPLMEEWQRVARLTATNISSMLSDVRKGKKDTEIDYFNGYLMRLAGRYGVFAPVNASLVDLVKLRTSIPLDSPV